ncbi:hypothetical protein K491DRAFT_313396 [Lophiostoma macrostomum CBS 122681]|uniref:Uncharacterized protein n=1 Tax=Lophiostoma macrostomum CBS 122681 TaxID=1314788 RepID=A0A6A6SHL6_9PLEO|nr:hypothetical protein K491DRAFT_313396 [Lophiostoma macrostomum CBS 122681]
MLCASSPFQHPSPIPDPNRHQIELCAVSQMYDIPPPLRPTISSSTPRPPHFLVIHNAGIGHHPTSSLALALASGSASGSASGAGAASRFAFDLVMQGPYGHHPTSSLASASGTGARFVLVMHHTYGHPMSSSAARASRAAFEVGTARTMVERKKERLRAGRVSFMVIGEQRRRAKRETSD